MLQSNDADRQDFVAQRVETTDPFIDAAPFAARYSAFRVIDARLSRSAYEAGHLPGAVFADWSIDLADTRGDPARGGRHPLPDPAAWCATLARWGITAETPVAVYDDAGGALSAARAWWMLQAVGVADARIVSGGFAAALAAGIPAARGPGAAPAPAPVMTGRAWLRPTVPIEDVAAGRVTVIDVRAAERWRGEVEPIDPAAGRIVGALNLPYEHLLLPDGRIRDAETLRALFAEATAGRDDRPTAAACGSGVTACLAVAAAVRAGLPPPALYVGGFSEWCRSGRPIERG